MVLFQKTKKAKPKKKKKKAKYAVSSSESSDSSDSDTSDVSTDWRNSDGNHFEQNSISMNGKIQNFFFLRNFLFPDTLIIYLGRPKAILTNVYFYCKNNYCSFLL